MKKNIKLLLLCILTTALVMTLSFTALAADDSAIGVQIGNKTVDFNNVAPFVQDGRTFVPFRTVFRSVGRAGKL